MQGIVTDLDGTLLRDDKSISDYTVEILQRCRRRGLAVAFATARSHQAAERIMARFQPDLFIGYGGALVTTALGQVIARNEIPADVAAALVAACCKEPAITALYAINERVALSNNHAFLSQDGGDYAHYRYGDFEAGVPQGFLKISVDSRDKRAVETIGQAFPMCDLLHYTGESLSRFAHRQAVKWAAVQAAAAHMGIATTDLIAFGDDQNDVEMLQNCSWGVAVANGIVAAKQAANAVCAGNEQDGVGAYLQEYFGL